MQRKKFKNNLNFFPKQYKNCLNKKSELLKHTNTFSNEDKEILNSRHLISNKENKSLEEKDYEKR